MIEPSRVVRSLALPRFPPRLQRPIQEEPAMKLRFAMICAALFSLVLGDAGALGR